MSKLRRTFKQKFDEKAQAPRIFSGLLGNGFGKVDAGEGKAYVRIAGSVNTAVCSGVPYVNNLPVWVGYTPDFPNTLRVLGQQSTKASEFIDGVGKHGNQHEWMGHGIGGGTDVVKVHLQQFMPLMVMKYSGLQVMVYPGIAWVGTEYKLIADKNEDGKPIPQIIDLREYQPSSGNEYYILIGIKTDGTIELVEGSEVTEGTLTEADIPDASATMIYKLAAVRRAHSQYEIVVNREGVDIVDLRFPIWKRELVDIKGFIGSNILTTAGDLMYQEEAVDEWINRATVAQGASADAISQYEGYSPAYVIDENDSTYLACASNPVADDWFYIDLGQIRTIHRFRLKQETYNGGWGATSYKVQGLNDWLTEGISGDWTDIVTVTATASDETIDFSTPQTYRYFRFYALTGGGNSWNVFTAELIEHVEEPAYPDRLPIGTEGQVLKVSSGYPAWGSNTPVAHTHVEADITDLDHDAGKIDGITVDLTGITDGQVIKYDVGTTSLIAGDGGGGGAISDLTDVDLTGLADGDILVYDETSGDWLPEAPASGSSLTVEEQDGTPTVSNVNKIKVTNGTLTDDGSGVVSIDFGSAATDGAAIHDNEANEISAITEKTTLADDDLLIIEDSAASYVKKSVKISNLPTGGGSGETDVLMVQVFS